MLIVTHYASNTFWVEDDAGLVDFSKLETKVLQIPTPSSKPSEFTRKVINGNVIIRLAQKNIENYLKNNYEDMKQVAYDLDCTLSNDIDQDAFNLASYFNLMILNDENEPFIIIEESI